MKNNWPIKKLGEIAKVDWGNTSITKKSYTSAGYPAYSATGCDGLMPTFEQDRDAIILSAIGAQCGKTFYALGKWTAIKNTIIVYSKDEQSILTRFLYYYLNPNVWPISGAGQPFIGIGNAKKIDVPVPPKTVQQKVVNRLDAILKVQELNNLQISHTQEFFMSSLNKELHPKGDWAKANISNIAKITSGYGFPKKLQGNKIGNIPFYKVSDMNLPENKVVMTVANNYLTPKDIVQLKYKPTEKGAVIFPKIGAAIATNKKRILSADSLFDNNVMGIIPNEEKILSKYLYLWLLRFDLSNWASQSAPPSMRKSTVENQIISLPSITEQQKTVEKLNAIQDYKKSLLKQKELLKELFNSVLQKSMNGEMD